MTPTQREAALRLINTDTEWRALKWEHDVIALLRELTADPVVNQSLTTEPQGEPVQEPVAYVDPRQLARGAAVLHCITRPEYRSWSDAAAGLEYTPVYLHPPQQRKPLTLEQIDRLDTQAIHSGPDSQYAFRFARLIEAAHDIKETP